MFAQRSPIIIIQNVIAAVLGYVGLLFVLRYIGSTDWGFVAFGIGFVGILSLFGDLGYSTAHTIKISKGEDIGSCNGTYLSIKLALGFLFIGLVFASLYIWTSILHRGFESPIEYWIIIAMIPYYFFQNFLAFTNTYFKATLKSMRASIPSLIEAILRNSIFIMLAFVIHFSASSNPNYMAALYLSATYSLTYTVYFVVSMLVGRPWKISKPSRRLIKEYTVLALPLVLVSSVGTISGNIDKVFIQFFWEAQATSAFFSSQQIAMVITTLASSLSMFFLPILIKRDRHIGKVEHNRSIFEFENITSLYLLPLVVALVILAPYVMNIFTKSYVIYSAMLSLLAFRAYLAALNSPYISAIASRSKTGTIAKIDTAMVLLNILLIALFVPPQIFGLTFFSLGWIGAPVAMVAVALVSAVIYRIGVSRMEGIKYNLHVFRHAIPAVAQTLFILAFIHFVSPRDILVLAPLAIVSILVYLGIAVAIKETTVGLLVEIVRNFMPGRLSARYKQENIESDSEFTSPKPSKKDY